MLPPTNFQRLLDLRHELIGQRAVDQSTVEAQREMADTADRKGVVLPPVSASQAHLYLLRGHAYTLLDDESSSRSDVARAALAGENSNAPNPGTPES